ncbi:MAG: NAD(P)H-binding protein [Bacteroidia bacterium]|nr:NAD(P)H-binding protein [Bacteroidia bacterium]
MNKRIVVMGATGNTGRPIAEQLLKQGHQVVALGREATKLEALKAQGAILAVGDQLDSAFLTQAFQGADVVYAMTPPNWAVDDFAAYQDAAGQATAAALAAAGVTKVVHLSSQGADLPAGNGPVAGLYRQEARLNLVPGLSVVHLRPTYFLENVFMFLGQVPSGTIYSHLQPTGVTPMIATADIAAVAARYLAEPTFTGRTVVDLLGAADYSFADVLAAFREHLGVPNLQWVVIPDDAQLAGMIQFGLKPSLAAMYVELGQAINRGFFANHVARSATNTTPTTLAQFAAQVLAPAYKAQGQAQA